MNFGATLILLFLGSGRTNLDFSSSCRQKEYSVEKLADYQLEDDWIGGEKTVLTFLMFGTTYYERKQFLIYGIANFVADFGGYLGLLLGYSLLAFYDEGKDLIRKLYNWAKGRMDEGRKSSRSPMSGTQRNPYLQSAD